MSKFARAFGYFSLGLGISLLIGYWLKQEELRSRKMMAALHPQPVEEDDQRIILSKAVPTPAPKIVDDLTRITGVGPKTAEALQMIGITSFTSMAAASHQEVLDKLKGVRGITPEKVMAWIKQASELAS